MFAKAEEFIAETEPQPVPANQREPLPPTRNDEQEINQSSDDDDDMPGPSLPGREPIEHTSRNTRSGPAIPNTQDLELQRGKPSLHPSIPPQHLTPFTQNSPTKTPTTNRPTSAPSAASTASPKKSA